MKANQIIEATRILDTALSTLYPTQIDKQKERYLRALREFLDCYGNREVFIFSTPGRVEVCGNHTDHQLGCVLAAAIDYDAIAIVSKSDTIRIKSEGYETLHIDLENIEFRENEKYTSIALMKGILARFKQLGYQIGGFDAYITSNVLKGSGMSSSANYEVLLATILNHLYNDGIIDPIQIAQIGQYAEVQYFGKPSGLMDQVACSLGGFVHIDFYEKEDPIVNKIDFDLSADGYQLIIIDAGDSHEDLNEEYGSITHEMKTIARHFNQDVLSRVDEEEFYKHIGELKSLGNERAILRAHHYFQENNRVLDAVDALNERDIDEFFHVLKESGYSSYMYLQNIFSPKDVLHQGLSLALALSELYLAGIECAYRVHGGGFGGTILVFLPKEEVEDYVEKMERVFGYNACHRLSLRNQGSIRVI